MRSLAGIARRAISSVVICQPLLSSIEAARRLQTLRWTEGRWTATIAATINAMTTATMMRNFRRVGFT
jgi:hypothetical protein